VGVGLLISASVPCTLASAVLWTRLAGGNEATALLVILISTLMSCVTTTAWLVTLIGAGVQVPFSAMMRDLLATLVLTVGVGQLSRAWPPLALFANRRIQTLSLVSQVLVLSIVLKAGARVGKALRDDGGRLGTDAF